MRLILTFSVFVALFFAGCSDDDDNTAAGGSSGGGSGVSIPFPAVGLLSVGGGHACLTESDGIVRCWGRGTNGRLGTNDLLSRRGPTGVISVGDGAGVRAPVTITDAEFALLGRDAAFTGGSDFVYDPSSDVFSNLESVMQVNAGGRHTCGLNFNGSLHCWGDNTQGQVGRVRSANPNTHSYDVAALVFGIEGRSTTVGTLTSFPLFSGNAPGYLYNVTNFDLGGEHTCAVYDSADDNGVVACWGFGQQGQLGVNALLPNSGGINASADNPQPVALDDATDVLSGMVQVAAGNQHTCALSEDGEVYCWGAGASTISRRELGVGPIPNTRTGIVVASTDAPVQVVEAGVDTVSDDTEALGSITQIAAGSNHTCALSTTGNVYCWGGSSQGQLGLGLIGAGGILPASTDVPRQVVGTSRSGALSGIIQITAGENHTCALSSSRRVYCWGSNTRSQLGAGVIAPTSNDAPLAVMDITGDGGTGRQGTLGNVVGIAAGGNNTCALQSNGRVVCWGENDNDELGLGAASEMFRDDLGVDGTSDLPVTVRANAYLSTPYEYR